MTFCVITVNRVFICLQRKLTKTHDLLQSTLRVGIFQGKELIIKKSLTKSQNIIKVLAPVAAL